MCHTQVFDMIQTCGNAGRIGCAGFNQTKKFSFILNAGAIVHTEITNMKLINDCIRDGVIIMRVFVSFPAFGVGRVQIDDHCASAVDTGCTRIRVTSFYCFPINIHLIGIINPIQISCVFQNPGSIGILLHF